MSLGELKEEARKYRDLKVIKSAFCKSTNTRSWKEAQERFPLYASEDKLSQFLKLDFCKSTPEAFKSFCHSVLQSELTSTTHPSSYPCNDATAYIVDQSCLAVSNSDIIDSGVPFTGYNLFIATIQEVLKLI